MELLLSGPQTLGGKRAGRASRMQPFESLEAVKNMLDALMTREEPLVRQLPPSPGSRAERFVQLLCPDLHPLDLASSDVVVGFGWWRDGVAGSVRTGLTERVDALQVEVAMLKNALRKLAASIGEPDPLGTERLKHK